MVCLVNSLLIWFPQRHMFPAAVRSVQSGLGYALVGRAWIGKQASALRTKQTTLSGHAPTLRVALQGSVQVTCFRCYRTSCAPVVLGPHVPFRTSSPPRILSMPRQWFQSMFSEVLMSVLFDGNVSPTHNQSLADGLVFPPFMRICTTCVEVENTFCIHVRIYTLFHLKVPPL